MLWKCFDEATRAYLGLTVGVLSLLALSEAACVSKLERFMEEVHIFLF